MLKTVYRCLESPNDSIYESGLSTLETTIKMYKEEMKEISGSVNKLLKEKYRAKFEKKITEIKGLLNGKVKK